MRNIREVSNGWILTYLNGEERISTNVADLLPEIGEFPVAPEPVNPNYVCYAPGMDCSVLGAVQAHMRNGRKIDAIKTLRDIYSPRMGLREAKELVEFMMSHMNKPEPSLGEIFENALRR